MGIKQEAIAFVGEFVGTAMFLFLGLAGVQTAQNSETASQQETGAQIALSNQTIMFISLSMGFSLLVNAWLFFRITGGLFNPAVTLALWLIGGISHLRAIALTIAQFAGGIAGAALVAGLLPYDVSAVNTTLQSEMNYAQGVFLEAFLTATLVFAVLMLAAEKHKATFIAPVGIGLALFICQLVGTLWTGCGMNPARSLGPAAVSASFVGYFWIYVVGPYLGSLIAVVFYMLLKIFDYGTVLLNSDSDDTANSPEPVFVKVWKSKFNYFHRAHRGMIDAQQADDLAEQGAAGGKSRDSYASTRPLARAGSEKQPKVAQVALVIPSQDTGGMASPMAHKPAHGLVTRQV